MADHLAERQRKEYHRTSFPWPPPPISVSRVASYIHGSSDDGSFKANLIGNLYRFHWRSPHNSLELQIIDGFAEAKAKADQAKEGSGALNDVVNCLHSLTTLRASILSRLASGMQFQIWCIYASPEMPCISLSEAKRVWLTFVLFAIPC